MKNTMSRMGQTISCIAAFLFSVLFFPTQTGFASIPPTGTSNPDHVKKEKSKFRPACYSTFMTLNVENIQFQRADPFFHYQNLAYGLKIGTMRNVGWYMSLMSNFYFNGFLTPIDIQEVNPLGSSTHSYLDGLFGLTFRYCKPLSFHLGVGYHYKTTNYKTTSGSWGHLPKEDVHGPMAAAGFMFHMSGFVLSAEAVANYNLKAHTFVDGLGVGFKLGIGFCVENKNSAKSTKTKIKKNSDKMPASELHFFPTTAGPEEYDVIFRHSYTKPKPEFMAILETDTLLSKLPQPEYLKTNHPDENLSADMPDGEAETHGQEVAHSEFVITKQEVKTASKNDSVGVTKTVKSNTVQLEQQSVQQPKQQPEQQFEQQPDQTAQTTPHTPQTIKTPIQEEKIDDMTQSSANPIPPCSELQVKDVDGNSYNTLAIGNQCWLRENMRTTRFSNGDSSMLGQSFDFRHAVRYCPGGDPSNVVAYGYLYNWNAVTHSGANNGNQYVQGMCPEGWHIPSIAEWEDLFGYLSGQSAMNCKNNTQYVAKALAAKSGWAVSEMDCAVGNQVSLNNVSGFNALPAGIFVGKFDFFGKIARFWSSSVSLAQGKCDVYMSWDEAVVKKSDQEPAVVGFSVRCLKN